MPHEPAADTVAATTQPSTATLPVGIERSFLIPPHQRDRVLLSEPWPRGAIKPPESAADVKPQELWSVIKGGPPIRHLTVYDEAGSAIGSATQSDSAGAQDCEDDTKGQLWEALLRFPSAPLWATHRAKPRMYDFPKDAVWPNYHTMRILGVGHKPGRAIRHVYLLHNGLNETRDLLFHYRLAAWILDKRRDAVCIIRPLPGHLTRYPFHGFFSETPLDEYLRDPMDLFRQFLRYMLETKWLLSIIAPRSDYDLVAGGSLLRKAPQDVPVTDRLIRSTLAQEITDEWITAFEDNEKNAVRAHRDQHSQQRVTQTEIEHVVADLHSVLGWKLHTSDAPPAPLSITESTSTEEDSTVAEYPYVHVVGYSIGGFMAQTCFFGWPQVICSCTNMFAGGALRDLAPTAFADQEEWQAVLHALRYEFDAALADGLLAPRSRRARMLIAGVKASDFRYMKRIFYEVYLQYYRGGYSSRVAEFSRRLLFVLGGDDPIVRTKNVLDAGPPEGITLLQLADIGHFPGGAAWKAADQKQVEKEQRVFWLPEIGRVIARFSMRTEIALHNTRAKCWGYADTAGGTGKRGAKLPSAVENDGLDNRTFESTLDGLLDIVDTKPGGWLLVSRNEIPPVFLGREGFREHAMALHHSEELIARYIQELHARAERLQTLSGRMTLLIPEQSAEWFNDEELRQKLLARSETPGAANLPTSRQLRQMLKYFDTKWAARGAVSLVTANEYEPPVLSIIGPAEATAFGVTKLSLTMLPDVWIGLAPGLCKRLRNFDEMDIDSSDVRQLNEEAVVSWAAGVSRKDKVYVSLLEDSVRNREMIALKVSAAEFNPRYRGKILAPELAGRALRHWALSYRAARRVNKLA